MHGLDMDIQIYSSTVFGKLTLYAISAAFSMSGMLIGGFGSFGVLYTHIEATFAFSFTINYTGGHQKDWNPHFAFYFHEPFYQALKLEF